LEKPIDENEIIGVDLNVKRVNFAKKELMTFWLKRQNSMIFFSFFSFLYIVNLDIFYAHFGSREAFGWKFYRRFKNLKVFCNPEVNLVG